MTKKNSLDISNKDINIDDIKNFPNHIGFILDGNRRWAKAQGRLAFYGHKIGGDNIANLCKWSLKYNIRYLTLYCLSVENLNRSKEELDFLFDYMKTALIDEKNYKNKHIRISVIGDFSILPQDLQDAIKYANSKKYNDDEVKLNLQLCIGYSGRREILYAIKNIASDVKGDIKKIQELHEEDVKKYMWSYSFPDVDLIIRTGGECRLSNFLLWQASYSEFYFCDTMWPAFCEKDFLLALYFFSSRNRRYGR